MYEHNNVTVGCGWYYIFYKYILLLLLLHSGYTYIKKLVWLFLDVQKHRSQSWFSWKTVGSVVPRHAHEIYFELLLILVQPPPHHFYILTNSWVSPQIRRVNPDIPVSIYLVLDLETGPKFWDEPSWRCVQMSERISFALNMEIHRKMNVTRSTEPTSQRLFFRQRVQTCLRQNDRNTSHATSLLIFFFQNRKIKSFSMTSVCNLRGSPSSLRFLSQTKCVHKRTTEENTSNSKFKSVCKNILEPL